MLEYLLGVATGIVIVLLILWWLNKNPPNFLPW